MRRAFRTGLGLVMGAAMSFAVTGTAGAAEFDLTLATLPVPGTTFDMAIKDVPQRVEEATNGRVKILVNDSLVGGTQLAPAVRDGRVDLVSAIHPYLSGQEPRMGLSNLPGLIDSAMDYKFAFDSFYGQDLAEIWKEKWNATVLAEGLWANQLVWSKRPVEKVEDFRGLKIRVHNRETAILMNAIGAKPTPMAAAEVMAGLQRGVIDALITSACYGYKQEFWRIAEHVYNWRIAPQTGWAVLVNNQVWERIPADVQAQIRGTMHEMQERMFHEYYAHSRRCIKGLQDNGVNFKVAQDSEIERVFEPENTKAVYQGWYERAKQVGFDGPAYVERVRMLLGMDIN